MDNFDNDSNNLLEFIETKIVKKEEKDPKKMIYMYTKCLRNAITNVYNEQQSVEYAVSCCDLISHIFKIIYNHSLNIKLSLFICERSTLLFNEYINISHSYSSDKINLIDVKQFIINKSIGPIIQSQKVSDHLSNTCDLLAYFKTFIANLFSKYIKLKNSNIDLSDFLENTISILINSYSNIYYLGYINYIENEKQIILKSTPDNIVKNINLSKIKCELFLYCINNLSYTYHNSKKCINLILEKKGYIIDDYQDINEFFEYTESISDKPFFQKLIKDLKSN